VVCAKPGKLTINVVVHGIPLLQSTLLSKENFVAPLGRCKGHFKKKL
jgi:hypothetical protein